jgi:hypothetical protein
MVETLMGWLEDKITEQFLSWEMLGRGVLPPCDFAVSPEPPFRAFPGYRMERLTGVDDGRRPSLIESWLGTNEPPKEPEEEEPIDFSSADSFPQVEIRTHLPKGYPAQKETFQSFLLCLTSCRGPLSFEVFGTSQSIEIQLVTEEDDAELVQRQATSWFPEAFFSTRRGGLAEALGDERTERIGITDCGLAKVFHFPINCGRGDLLSGIVGAMSDFDPGEVGLLQVLFEPVRHPWARGIFETVICGDGDPFFSDGEHLARGAREKVSKPLFGVVVRFAVTANSSERLTALMRTLLAPLRVASASGGNELEPILDEEEQDHLELAMLTERSSRRFGMILNLDELTQLVHFPTTVHRSKLVQSEIRSRPAPVETLSRTGLELGLVRHRGVEQTVRLSIEQRVRHTHLIGASGTGKSTLMLNLIRQDLENGEGFALLDPHGDLVDAVLASVPEHRIRDVILFDPSDEEFPIGFNILSAHSELEKTLLASDLCSVFRRFSTSWGDQMTAVLSNAILAVLESSRGGTLADLRRFLVDKPFRKEFLKTVQDPEVVYFWEHDHTFLSGRPEGSVVTRLNSFLRPKPIRYMVSQQENKLDFANLMDEGKVLLARIPQGLIGEENAHLLGSLLVSKIHQLVMGRQARAAESRRPFWLYIDEFHHFMTASMGAILSGARKYNLGLTLAHQDLRQLEARDRDVESAVLSNAFTRVAFRVGDHDARTLEEGFSHYGREDLQNLGTGQAICRVGGAENDFCLEVPWRPIPSDLESGRIAESVRSHSRKRYARPKAEIERELSAHVPKSEVAAEDDDSGAKEEAFTREDPQVSGVSREAVETPKTPGRGGAEHKALQQFVKQIAEGFGWRATIEKPVLGGRGHVDVALERGDLKIAVEISVTTPVEKEMENLRKCLEAGFNPVVMLCPDHNQRMRIKMLSEKVFSSNDLASILFLELGEFSQLLAAKVTSEPDSQPAHIRGLKVKSSYSTATAPNVRSIKENLRKLLLMGRRSIPPTGR